MIRVLAILTILVAPLVAQTLRDRLPSDLPLDADGIPTRPLNDEELYRLLLAYSAVNDSAVLLLAACHAAGRGYGAPGWRECVIGQGDRSPR